MTLSRHPVDHVLGLLVDGAVLGARLAAARCEVLVEQAGARQAERLVAQLRQRDPQRAPAWHHRPLPDRLEELQVLRDFRDFVTRGSVVELAVAVVVAFALVNLLRSLVSDVVTPLVGVAGGLDLGGLAVTLRGSTIRYGAFLNELVSFLLTAAAVFFGVVKPLAAYHGRRAPAAEPTTRCGDCLSTVPAAARRCPFCTSHLPAADLPART